MSYFAIFFPRPRDIQWSRVNDTLPERAEKTGNILQMSRLSQSHNGTYLCQAHNNYGRAADHYTLLVYGKKTNVPGHMTPSKLLSPHFCMSKYVGFHLKPVSTSLRITKQFHIYTHEHLHFLFRSRTAWVLYSYRGGLLWLWMRQSSSPTMVCCFSPPPLAQLCPLWLFRVLILPAGCVMYFERVQEMRSPEIFLLSFSLFLLLFLYGNDSHQIRTLTRQLGERRWVGMSSFIPLLSFTPSLFCSFYPQFCVGEPLSFETPLHFRKCPRNPFLCLFILPSLLPPAFFSPSFTSSLSSFMHSIIPYSPFIWSLLPSINPFFLGFFFLPFISSYTFSSFPPAFQFFFPSLLY